MIGNLRRLSGAAAAGALSASVASACVAGLLQVGILTIVARLVSPADYGLVAGTMAALALLSHVMLSGLERALLLLPGLDDAGIDATFVAALLAGGAGSLVAAGAALLLWLAGLVATPPAVFLILASLPLLTGAGLVFRSRLRSRMAFGRLAFVELAAQLIGTGLVTISAAAAGYGAVAIAAGLAVQAALSSGLAAALARRRVRFLLDPAALRPVLRLGGQLLRTSMLEVVTVQLPALTIGSLLGATALGHYSRVVTIVQVPLETLVTAASRVLYGLLIEARDQPGRLRATLASSVQGAGCFILAFAGGAAAAGREIVAVLLGQQWGEAVDLVPWVCLTAAAAMLGHLFAMFSEATLRLTSRFRIQIGCTALLASALPVAAMAGLLAAAATVAIAAMLFLALHLRLAARTLEVSAATVLGWLTPGLAAGAAAGLWVHLLPGLLPPGLGAAWLLCCEVAGCGAISGGCMLALQARGGGRR